MAIHINTNLEEQQFEIQQETAIGVRKLISKPKWWEDVEITTHSVGNEHYPNRITKVFHFPHISGAFSKVVQFTSYNANDPERQLADLLESAIYELKGMILDDD